MIVILATISDGYFSGLEIVISAAIADHCPKASPVHTDKQSNLYPRCYH